MMPAALHQRMVVGEEAKARLDAAIQDYSVKLHTVGDAQRALSETNQAMSKERAAVLVQVCSAVDEKTGKALYSNDAARQSAVEIIMPQALLERVWWDEGVLATAKAEADVALQVIRSERGFLAFLTAAVGGESEDER